MNVVLSTKFLQESRHAVLNLACESRKLSRHSGPHYWVDERVRLEGSRRIPHVIVRADDQIYSVPQFSKQIEILAKLIKLNRSADAIFRELLSGLKVAISEMQQVMEHGLELAKCRAKRGSDDEAFRCVLCLFVVDGVLTLPPWHVNRNENGRDATDRLNPCWQFFLKRSRDAWLFTHQSPDEQAPCRECHNRHHRPIAVGTSLFHGLPPFLTWILPSGVTA